MIYRPRAEGPTELASAFFDWHVVDRRFATPHQPCWVELPLLVAMASEPVTTVVTPLVCKADRNSILRESPDFLDEPVLQLARPFALQKRDDCGSATKKLSS